MSEETQNNDLNQDDTNLDLFEAEFYQKEKNSPAPEAAPAEEAEEGTEEEQDDQQHVDDPDAEADAEEDDTEEEDTEEAADSADDGDEPEEKPKKQSAQDRIKELNAKYREEQRAREDLERRLKELETKAKEPEPTAETAEPKGPQAPDPEALNEDGLPLYPLGEIDPDYVRDLTKHLVELEKEAIRNEFKQEREREARTAHEQQMAKQWMEKVEAAKESIPDIEEKGKNLVETFANIDGELGEYLAGTIMSLENGPAVLAYLADNLDEANEIVASGVQSATLALGRIDALVSTSSGIPSKPTKKKVTKAKNPPPTNRGQSGRFTPAADTDDLDAFESVFYSDKK